MATSKRAFERAMRLAAISGLRATFGVALLQAAHNKPNKKEWAMAAMGEMAFDKLPFAPSRAGLLGMIPRAAAGAYVAKEVMDKEGVEDQWAAPMGAVVAAGVAVLAPRLRSILSLVVPGALVGLAEDYIALKVGGEAVGMTMQDVQQLGQDSFQQVQHYVESFAADGSNGARKPQSVGAGSM